MLFYFFKFSFVAEIQGLKVTPRLSTKADFSGVDISFSIEYRNKGSSVLYSSWAGDHLCKPLEQLDCCIYLTIQADILNA